MNHLCSQSLIKGIFDKLQKCIYVEHLTISKNSEFNHGGSQHINEAPHEFSLNFWKTLLGSKNRIELNQFWDSQFYLLFGNI